MSNPSETLSGRKRKAEDISDPKGLDEEEEEEEETKDCDMDVEQQPVVAATISNGGICSICCLDDQIVILGCDYIYKYSIITRSLIKKTELTFDIYEQLADDVDDDVMHESDWDPPLRGFGNWVYNWDTDRELIDKISIDDGLVLPVKTTGDHVYDLVKATDDSLVVKVWRDGDLKKIDANGHFSDFLTVPKEFLKDYDYIGLDINQDRKRLLLATYSILRSYSLDDSEMIWEKDLVVTVEGFGDTITRFEVHPCGSIYVLSHNSAGPDPDEIYRISSDGKEAQFLCAYRHIQDIAIDSERGELYFISNKQLLRISIPDKVQVQSGKQTDPKAAWFQILANPESLDVVTFVVEERCVYASKSVLRQRSGYFKAMLSNNWREGEENKCVINDAKYEAFNAVITFLYSQTLEVQIEFANEILRLADMYQIPDLKELYERYFISTLTEDNMFEIFELSQSTSASVLSKGCLSFMEEHKHHLKQSNVLESLSKETLLVVMKAIL